MQDNQYFKSYVNFSTGKWVSAVPDTVRSYVYMQTVSKTSVPTCLWSQSTTVGVRVALNGDPTDVYAASPFLPVDGIKLFSISITEYETSDTIPSNAVPFSLFLTPWGDDAYPLCVYKPK